MSASHTLPDYKEQRPEVAARFQRLVQRPIALQVADLTKKFSTPRGIVTALDGVSFSVHQREFTCVIARPVAENPHLFAYSPDWKPPLPETSGSTANPSPAPDQIAAWSSNPTRFSHGCR